MADRNSSYKLNEFASVDYKKPSGKHPDMRTSTYRAHYIIDDTTLGNKIHLKFNEAMHYEEDPVLELRRTPNYKANYIWKFGNPDETRNVTLGKTMHLMKPLHDRKLKFIKRSMRPMCSVARSDYVCQPDTPAFPKLLPRMQIPVPTTKIFVDRNKPGYLKLLDPNATTSKLDYCYRSPIDIMNSIATNDCITYWNWKGIVIDDKSVFRAKDELLCDSLPSKRCKRGKTRVSSLVKPVPNSGLTTEVRENYKRIEESASVLADIHEKNYNFCAP